MEQAIFSLVEDEKVKIFVFLALTARQEKKLGMGARSGNLSCLTIMIHFICVALSSEQALSCTFSHLGPIMTFWGKAGKG